MSKNNELVKIDPTQLGSPRQTVCMILVDASGSMENYQAAMERALYTFKNKLLSSSVSDEIIVNIVHFTQEINYDIGNVFTSVENMPIDYIANGGTALYDAIAYGRKKLLNYLEELRNAGISAKGIFVIFSDGQDEHSRASLRDAKIDIEILQSEREGNIVAFVAFGEEAKGIAECLNIRTENIWNTDATFDDLCECFDVISSSVATVSQRVDFVSTNENKVLFVDLG